MATDPSKQVKLGFVSGLVPREKSMAFERILFLATRGNVFLQQSVVENSIVDPISGKKVEKNVFVVFYSGEIAKNKILKICEAFGANRYPFIEDPSKQYQIMTDVSGRLAELKTTIDVGSAHLSNLLQTIGFEVEQWNLQVKKEKSIYHTLNMLSIDVTKKCLVAEDSKHTATSNSRQQLTNWSNFPGFANKGITTNLFSHKQIYFCLSRNCRCIRDCQVPRKESRCIYNSHIPFPFCCDVWCLGPWCLLAVGNIILHYEGKEIVQSEAWRHHGNDIWWPLCYHDDGNIFNLHWIDIQRIFFSHIELFGPSAYACRDLSCRVASTTGLMKARATYPFGVDRKWHGTQSELPILNSLKMKMSILLGVAQMNLGIIISYFNAKFFGENLNVRYQFVPQMIF